MAISEDILGVSITITINDQPLPEQEFPDPVPEERTVNTLVEAQSNQVFEVQMTIGMDTVFEVSDLSFKIFVDGRRIDEPLIPSGVLTMGEPSTGQSLGFYVSLSSVRKFQFADVVAVEEQSHSISSRSHSVRTSSKAAPPPGRRLYTGGATKTPIGRPLEDLRELGTIKVEVRHVSRGESLAFGAGRAMDSMCTPTAWPGAQKSNITHQVKSTAPEKTTAVSGWNTNNVQGVPNPAATFIFHYRSKEGLQSMLALAAKFGRSIRMALQKIARTSSRKSLQRRRTSQWKSNSWKSGQSRSRSRKETSQSSRNLLRTRKQTSTKWKLLPTIRQSPENDPSGHAGKNDGEL